MSKNEEKKVRVTIMVPQNLIEKIDQFRKEHKCSRGTVVRMALHQLSGTEK